MFPCQWPPVGASAGLLSAYDGCPASAGNQETGEADQKDEPMKENPTPSQIVNQDKCPDDLADLSPSQLRSEIARLEGVLQGWQPSTLPSLRKQLEEALARARRELTSRRSTGRTLDQAESRHKQTQQTAQLAESQLKQAQQTVQVGTNACVKPRKTNRLLCRT